MRVDDVAGNSFQALPSCPSSPSSGSAAAASVSAPASCTFLMASPQGITLVHFSAQLEPCLSQESTLHTLNTP